MVLSKNKSNSSLALNWKQFRRDVKKSRSIYIMAIPVVLFYVIFHYLPMYGVSIAFMDYRPVLGITGSEWVGFKHFSAFFSDPYCWRLLRNTFLIGIYQIIFSMPAAIIFALLVNEISNMAFKRLVQTVSYLPHFISLVVVCGILQTFLSSEGLITQFLTIFGMEKKNLLTEPDYFRTIYVGSGIWQTIGWNSIVYLAALSGIDVEQYEAAKVDGVGRFKCIWYITLPGIMPTIATMLIIKLGSVLSVGYEKIILLYNSATQINGDVISSYVYRIGLTGNYPQYSYASAVGLFTSLVNLLFVITGNTLSKKLSGSGLW